MPSYQMTNMSFSSCLCVVFLKNPIVYSIFYIKKRERKEMENTLNHACVLSHNFLYNKVKQ